MAETVVVLPPEQGDEDEFGLVASGLTEDQIEEFLDLNREDKLDPETVAQRARDPENPLHDLIFREDDETAAWRYRVDLAQRLIQRVRIIPLKVKITGGGVSEVELEIRTEDAPRAFTSVREEGRRFYKDTPRALKENRNQVIAELNGQVRAIVKRRMMILSLDEIADSIAGVIEEIRNEQ